MHTVVHLACLPWSLTGYLNSVCANQNSGPLFYAQGPSSFPCQWPSLPSPPLHKPCTWLSISLSIIPHILDVLTRPTASSYKCLSSLSALLHLYGHSAGWRCHLSSGTLLHVSAAFSASTLAFLQSNLSFWKHELGHVLPQTSNPSILPSSFKMKYKMSVKIYKTPNNMATPFFIIVFQLISAVCCYRGENSPNLKTRLPSPFIKTALQEGRSRHITCQGSETTSTQFLNISKWQAFFFINFFF